MNEEQILQEKEFHPFASELKKVADSFKPKEEEVKAESPLENLAEKINPTPKEEPKTEAVPAAKEDQKEAEPTEELKEPEFNFGEPDSTPEPSTQAPVELLKKIGGALEFGDLKDESDLIAKVTELKTQRDKYKQEVEIPFDGVPEVLKEAVEAAKKGADWYSLMGFSTDYSKLDPVQVFEYEYEMQLKARYQKPDGTVDYDKLDADLDAFPEAEKVMRGNDIIRQKTVEQNARKAEIFAQAQQSKQLFESKLAESTKNVSKFFPKDRYGVSFEPKHTEYLYSGISSRNLVKKHLGNIDESVLSRLDTDKLARTIAAAELVGNISEFRYKQGQVEKARELLAKNTNAAIETPAVPARPELTGDKPLTPQERLAKYHEQFRGQGRL
jgi:hypothetical protein